MGKRENKQPHRRGWGKQCSRTPPGLIATVVLIPAPHGDSSRELNKYPGPGRTPDQQAESLEREAMCHLLRISNSNVQVDFFIATDLRQGSEGDFEEGIVDTERFPD